MKAKINSDELVNWWLDKYHNTNLDEVREKHGWEDGKDHSREFYEAYKVSQEQHDEWYEWAIRLIMKRYRRGKKWAKEAFVFPYLNVAPSTYE